MTSMSLPPDHRGQGARMFEATFKSKPRAPPPSTSFDGKTCVITGSNQGLGLRCAEVMLEYRLTHLIMAVRSVDKGKKAASPLRKAHPGVKIEVWPLDMLKYDSIRGFAKRCEEHLPRLDIAILNAGYWEMDSWRFEPSTGHETTVQVNYLSTALLAILLLPTMKRSSRAGHPGRLSIISSGLAMASQFTNRDAVPLIPSFDEKLGAFSVTAGQERYQTTKLMVCMLAYKLSQLVTADEIIVNAVDPGFTKGTALLRDAKGLMMKAVVSFATVVARTPTQGVWCYIDGVATKGKESHGSFVMDWHVSPFNSMMYTPSGKQTTERLWEETLDELDFAGVRSITKSLRD